ncbi:MAG TPA: electron transfer flavoprotein subunit alpha/FixB family protein [Candidatus Dormibacteraeota bacterium]|nr:electron transfer flavoprotein subunit alpha/FixB family protein [Candidatus Dormibacteraeota bacterium]
MSVLVLMEDGDPSLQTLTLARAWGDVHTVRMDAIAPFAPDAMAAILERAAADQNATAVFAAGTDRGNDVMARLAARTGLPFAANVVAADPSGTVTRQRWGGSLLETATLSSARLLITAAPYAFRVTAGPEPAPVDVRRYVEELDPRDLVVQVKEHIDPPGGGVSLAEAKVVVSGGRGVGSADGFAIIEDLTRLLGGRVGCSRVVTSAGWRPHSDQVGQTGTKISPELYIACGISGATQHMAGCKGAKKILAINSDPEAPIMSLADYSVVGDLKEVVPAISAEIRKARS